jgi:3-oxoadipate enol-lactonase
VSAVALFSVADGAPAEQPLVLAGSLGTTLEMWEPSMSGLADRHVIRFDHRGHGRSPCPSGPYEIADLGEDVVALLDRLGLERVSFAGVSIGGMVGLWLAANAPERIERLVTICSSAYLPPPQRWAQRAATVRSGGTVAVIADAVVERWFTPAYSLEHPDTVAWTKSMLRDSPVEGYAACCGAIERMDLRGSLARIVAPVLAITAQDDLAIPPEHTHAIAAGVANCRVVVLDDGAHLVPIECPAVVAALICQHLEGDR